MAHQKQAIVYLILSKDARNAPLLSVSIEEIETTKKGKHTESRRYKINDAKIEGQTEGNNKILSEKTK